MTKQLILVADDTPLDVSVFVTLLEGHYRVHVATCCDEVRAVLADRKTHGKVDLVLIDLRLKRKKSDVKDPPAVTGYMLYQDLKKSRRLVGTKVVFTTRYDLLHEEEEITAHGLNFFYKPDASRTLLKCVRSLLRSSVGGRRKK